MNILGVRPLAVALFFQSAAAFSSLARPSRSQVCSTANVVRTKKAFVLPVTASENGIEEDLIEAHDDDDESMLIEDIDADEGDEEETLVLNFIQMVQAAPPGELQMDEVDLLREIMSEYMANEVVVEGVEAAQVIETLLYRLVSEWKTALKEGNSEKEEAFRPTSADFAVAISAWETSKNPDKVVHVLSILSDQRELYVSDHPSIQPDLSVIKTVLHTLANSRERGIDKRAMQVFESLDEFGLAADAELHGIMVTIIAKSRFPGAPEKAERLLRDGIERYPPELVNGKFTGIHRDVFNTVVVAYAKSGKDNAPEKAQELISLMDQLDSDNGSLGICNPNAKTFTSLIDAYCQQNEWESVNQADRILNRLLEQYLEGNDDLEPNVATWTIVISAWGRLSKKNRGGAADRAGRLLRRMEDLNSEGKISCKADAITYVRCMNAYAFARGGEDAGEAEKLLEEMNEMYLDGDDTMKPSSRSVRVVADAWIKSGDMESAEQFLDDFESFLDEGDDKEEIRESQRDMFRSMMFGYSQQGNMERARFYLDYMIEKGLRPDCFCFDKIIEANTRVNAENSLKESLQVFELMEQCHRSGDVRPNERVYTSFIRAITRGRAQGMHKKAEVLLKRMQNLYEEGNDGIQPTVFTYNAVLNACAESIYLDDTPKDEAFKTAVRVFTGLRNGIEGPDHVTFGNMLRCARLLTEGEQREKFVSATFRLCCEQGHVNNFVLRDLQLAATEDFWRSLLDMPTGDPDTELLPSSWSYRTKMQKEKRDNDFNGRPQRGGGGRSPGGRGGRGGRSQGGRGGRSQGGRGGRAR